jgi:hypothetical protein
LKKVGFARSGSFQEIFFLPVWTANNAKKKFAWTKPKLAPLYKAIKKKSNCNRSASIGQSLEVCYVFLKFLNFLKTMVKTVIF